MPSVGGQIRVYGIPGTLTKLGNIRREPQRAMRAAAVDRGAISVARFQTELTAEYQSEWATGQIARSMRAKVKNERDGVSIQFTARSGARDHLQYITAAVPGGFNKFPVVPFEIVPVASKLLHIRFPGHVRRFIQDPTTGRLSGAKGGRILAKKVWWGHKSGGFHRDVIVEVAQSEGQSFVADMMAAVAESIAKATR